MKIQLTHTYNDIICLENLCLAWQEFVVGKKSKIDVQLFAYNLMDNIVALHNDLANQSYQHGGYQSFYINDPKRRHIHKASVRDRLLHHAVYRILYPFFDKTFIFDSYSCRVDKGLHKAINRFREFCYKVSKNHIRTCWLLKCDIKKFFASVNHKVLLNILNKYIPNKDILWLLNNIIDSFHTAEQSGKGMPLGNLTSQLLANIYMNHFDQWVKHSLKAEYYIRYADDFVFVSADKKWLRNIMSLVDTFLTDELNLSLHPNKVIIKTFSSGVDFLGWVLFSDYRVLRRTTRSRMLMRVKQHATNETLQSYMGLLKHGNTFKIKEQLLAQYQHQLCQLKNITE